MASHSVRPGSPIPVFRRPLPPAFPTSEGSSNTGSSSTGSPHSPRSTNSSSSSRKSLKPDTSTITIEEMMKKLPAELIELVMVHVLCDYDYTNSAFAERFSPSWIGWQNPSVRNAVVDNDYMRAEVYTAGTEGRRGTYKTDAGPVNVKGHIHPLASQDLPHNTDVLQRLREASPVIFEKANDEVRRKQVAVFMPPRFKFPYSRWSTGPEWERRIDKEFETRAYVIGSTAPTILPFRWPDLNLTILSLKAWNTTRENETKPLFMGIRHLMLGSTRIATGEYSVTRFDRSDEEAWRHRMAPGYVAALDERVVLEQAAWLYLDWEWLGQLESLHINLECLEQISDKLPVEDMVTDAAAKMCYYLRLELLVIYGLKSGRCRYISTRDMSGLYHGEDIGHVPFDFSIKDIEDSPELEHLGQRFTNWMHMFRGALRPGGQLILLDEKENDEFGWEMTQGVQTYQSDNNDAPLWMDYSPNDGEEFKLADGGFRNLTVRSYQQWRRWDRDFSQRISYKTLWPRSR